MKSEGKLESTLRKIKTKKHNKPNLKEAATGCLQGNLQTYIKKKKSQINNMIFHLKILEKEEQTEPKSRTS